VAHGVLVSGQLADRIFYAGAALPSFKAELVLVVLLLLAMVLGPLLVFVPQLARARRRGLREYGALAQRYVRGFEAKWLRGGAPAGEALVGSADIQSLADLGNSFEVVRTMRATPITREAILQVALATLAPIAPLLLTMMPLEELLKKLVGVLL
jgi:AcrR family transcriptional regulator